MKTGPSSTLLNALSTAGFEVKQKVGKHLDNIRNTPVPNRPEGIISLIGLLVVVNILAWCLGGFQVLQADLPALLTGNALEITRGNHLFGTCLATIAFSLACAIVSAYAVAFLIGENKGDHAVTKELAHMSAGNQFGSLMFVVLLEEVIARGIFLGPLTLIPGMGGPVVFYSMFFIGNAIWSALHLANFKDPKDRHILRVVPQFIGGIFLTYIFLKFGFLMGVAVHLGYDALLFSMHKHDKFTTHDVWMTVYAGVLALVAFFCMGKPITDVAQWLGDNASVFAISGWNPWDYMKADVCISMALSFLFGLLLFDRPIFSKDLEKASESSIYLMVGSLVGVAVMFGLYWVTGLVTHTMVVRVLAVGVLLACLQREQSGSAVARAFWCSVPSIFVTLCVMEAVGFWWAVAIVILEHLLELPIVALQGARLRATAEDPGISEAA